MRYGLSQSDAAKMAAARRAELSSLMLDLADLKRCLAGAYRNFNSSVEPELIEASVYEINSLQSKYAYLVRMIKTIGNTNAQSLSFSEKITSHKPRGGDSS